MSENQQIEQTDELKPDYGFGIVMGLLFWIAFGVALNNFLLGLPLGIVMGLAFSQMRKKKSGEE